MNKCTIIGNLTRDPQVRTVNTYNGEVTVCSFGVAVNNRRRSNNNDQGGQQAQQNDATFFNCTAWRQQGEIIARYMTKGQKICVTGPVSARMYQAQNGENRVSLEITVEDFEFVSTRADGANGGAYGAPAGGAYGAPAGGFNGGYSAPAPAAPVSPTAQNSGFTAVESDELPF